MMLGDYYQNIGSDPVKMVYHYTRAIECHKCEESAFTLGKYYYNERDYTKALKYLKLAESHTKALVLLGYYYRIIMPDEKAMLACYKKALVVDAKCHDALYGLALYYLTTGHNPSQGRTYMKMAIKYGSNMAMLNTALDYERANNYKGAKQYYIMAIEHGNKFAVYRLGKFYELCERDYKLAVEQYTQAIDKYGDIIAILALAEFYTHIAPNKALAEKYMAMYKTGVV
jgi:tetratricopeptide (TPR) repeat protein